MKKRKPKVSYLRTFLISIGAISLFLLTSTLYDWIQGDMDSSRVITLYIIIPALISVMLILGIKKLFHMIQSQFGVN